MLKFSLHKLQPLSNLQFNLKIFDKTCHRPSFLCLKLHCIIRVASAEENRVDKEDYFPFENINELNWAGLVFVCIVYPAWN